MGRVDDSLKSSSRSAATDEPRKPATGKPWQPGQSGNPKGRPRKGDALAEAIREHVPPGALIAVAIRVIEDPKSAPSVRLQAAQFLAERGYTKPVERHELAVGNVINDEPDLSGLSLDQLVELEQLEARRAELLAGADNTVAETPELPAGRDREDGRP